MSDKMRELIKRTWEERFGQELAQEDLNEMAAKYKFIKSEPGKFARVDLPDELLVTFTREDRP